MINYIKGNLLRSDEKVIMHGCNCFHMMGSGIAPVIAKKWPGVSIADDETPYGDPNKVGTVSTYYSMDDGILIINAYTQFSTSIGEDVFEYTGWVKILKQLEVWFGLNNGSCPIGMPLIGAGLARGCWPAIAALMDHHAPSVQFNVYILPHEFEEHYGKITAYQHPLRVTRNAREDLRPAGEERDRVKEPEVPNPDSSGAGKQGVGDTERKV